MITTSFANSCQEETYGQEFFLACCDWESAVEEEREEKRQEQLCKENLQAISDGQQCPNSKAFSQKT